MTSDTAATRDSQAPHARTALKHTQFALGESRIVLGWEGWRETGCGCACEEVACVLEDADVASRKGSGVGSVNKRTRGISVVIWRSGMI